MKNFIKKLGNNAIFPKDTYPGGVFDKDSNIIVKIICAIWMFFVISLVFSGLLFLILDATTAQLIELLFFIITLYLINKVFGIFFAFIFLLAIPLIFVLLEIGFFK